MPRRVAFIPVGNASEHTREFARCLSRGDQANKLGVRPAGWGSAVEVGPVRNGPGHAVEVAAKARYTETGVRSRDQTKASTIWIPLSSMDASSSQTDARRMR